MKNKIRFTGILLFVLTFFISLACAQSVKPPESNVLRLGVHVSKIGKMDPHFAAASQDRILADMVFNGLLRYVPGNAPKIEPDLARAMPEFKMENGKQIWTFKLKKGIMFHPGPSTKSYELTADDIIFSLNKSADKKYCAYSSEYTHMLFKKIDRYTVSVTLEKPLSSILFFPKFTNYAGGFIVSKKAFDTMGYGDFKNHPVGTGPFVFTRHLPENKIVLTANKDYFRGQPKLNGVEIHFVKNIEKREAGFYKGELDIIYGHGKKEWIERIEKLKDTEIDTHGVGEVATIYFNTRIKPFNNIKVRKAMAYALKREAFLEAFNKRFTGKVYSPVPDMFLPGGLPKKAVNELNIQYSLDLAKARQLLKEAGYPDGFNINLVSSEKRYYQSLYNILKEQLAQVGVNCQIKVVPHSDMHKTIRKKPQPIVLYGAWRPNADVYLTRFFHSNSIVVTGSKPDTNFSCYDKVDQLIEDARLEINPEKQIHMWEQAQIRILYDMVAFPVLYTIQLYIRKPYVNYGHSLTSTMALYPQFTENTRLIQ